MIAVPLIVRNVIATRPRSAPGRLPTGRADGCRGTCTRLVFSATVEVAVGDDRSVATVHGEVGCPAVVAGEPGQPRPPRDEQRVAERQRFSPAGVPRRRCAAAAAGSGRERVEAEVPSHDLLAGGGSARSWAAWITGEVLSAGGRPRCLTTYRAFQAESTLTSGRRGAFQRGACQPAMPFTSLGIYTMATIHAHHVTPSHTHMDGAKVGWHSANHQFHLDNCRPGGHRSGGNARATCPPTIIRAGKQIDSGSTFHTPPAAASPLPRRVWWMHTHIRKRPRRRSTTTCGRGLTTLRWLLNVSCSP